MTKRDLESKLKSRLNEWEAYGEQPSVPSVSETEREAPQEAVLSPSAPVENRAIVSAGITPNPAPPDNAEIPPAEPEVEELRAALERERDQSRRLLDVVAREQVLHAVTLQSRLQRPPAPAVPPERKAGKVERPRTAYEMHSPSSAKTYVWLYVVALFIAVLCTSLAYALVR